MIRPQAHGKTTSELGTLPYDQAMSPTPRYLTKSRFTLALQCPTKLYYAGKPEYLDRSADDSFLAALAEGGYQVGALACLHYPGGVLVDEPGHAAQLETTRQLLQRDEVTIYEAALEAEGLFVRVDILRKRGDEVELIEVKAKSWNPDRSGDFRNAKGGIDSGFKPYLYDVAFQAHVAAMALPGMRLRCFLMLADTSATATVDGLNQRFRVRRDGRRVQVTLAPETDASSIGAPTLRAVPVDSQIAQLQAEPLQVGTEELAFANAVRRLATAYRQDARIDPRPSAACGPCQFKATDVPAPGEPRSGFHECWASAFGWSEADFAGGTVLDLWNFRGKQKLIDRRVLKLSQVQTSDLGFDGAVPGEQGMTPRHRQWYQVSPDWPGGGAWFFDREGFTSASRDWKYPLHFIDFETCAVAIPFGRGRRPYETVAFQFSHHVMHADGQIEHRDQFLEATPGVDPCLPFLRALRDALNTDDGTVFRWAAHENTVLNQLRTRLLADPAPPDDAAVLVAFIESITVYEVNGKKIPGPRNMVDLCELAERFYFHPQTRGSSSLKKVLPALMASLPILRETYSEPRYGGPGMPSLNLQQGVAWWVQRDGSVCDPYDLLPPVFTDVSREEQQALDAAVAPELQDGGAAMAAYARLQFEDMDVRQRQSIEQALLRYCELDTLAMVMAVQAWLADAGTQSQGR